MSKAPENPIGEDILQIAVNGHRMNDGFVCPYAKMVATTKTLTDLSDTDNLRKEIESALQQFHKEKPASLIYIIPAHPKNHEEGREQTENVFAHLRRAALSISPGTLIDPRSKNRAFSILPLGTDKLLAIGLNPLYPEQHPRYSPEPIVAVTRVSDVLKLSEEQTFSIRQRAIRRLIQAHLPSLSIQEIEKVTTIKTLEVGRKLNLDVDIPDSLATPELLKAIYEYGMSVPLYLMPEEK